MCIPKAHLRQYLYQCILLTVGVMSSTDIYDEPVIFYALNNTRIQFCGLLTEEVSLGRVSVVYRL